MATRRQFGAALLGGAFLGAPVISLLASAKARADTLDQARMQAEFAKIEAFSGGRLGVAIRDTATGISGGHRENERFPICSTFKFLAAAAVLKRVDLHKEKLQRRIVFSQKDLVHYSPVTEQRTGSAGMSVAEICDAAVTMSDNSAGNLLLRTLGGPSGITLFTRSLGDNMTRLDRWETDLGEAAPGDPRDTTTPASMVNNLQKLLCEKTVLSDASQAQLLAWLAGCKTGDNRLRAKLPKDWRVGDKTGSGNHGSANDVAILMPPDRAPILVAVYLTQTDAPPADRDAAIAEVGHLIASAIAA
ncbi:class A beta-lactamase [Dongia soli]|uniref:Beta-lactamase n=1 Tax=Dongia soli TaxID=600628 RepID=A0ABU5EC89_9PROT|nr:class A beta-lactamase [Dongia soli]MDY0883404.1 class A beta-lactamase [Dongia soli]